MTNEPTTNLETAKGRHRAYIAMLRRMLASGINDPTVSADKLADAEREYFKRYGEAAS